MERRIAASIKIEATIEEVLLGGLDGSQPFSLGVRCRRSSKEVG